MNEELETQQQRFDKALALYQKNHFQEALEILQQIEHPGLIVLKLFYEGVCLVQLGRYEEGLKKYRTIREVPAISHGVEYDKVMYNLYINMGSILQHIGRRKNNELLTEAIICYEFAQKINDSDPQVWNNLGNCYLDLEQYSKAQQHFKEAIARDDEYPEAHYCLSLTYEFTQQYDLALEELKTALKWKPTNRIYLARIVALAFGQGEFEDAIKYAVILTDNHPSYAEGFKNLALIYYNLEQFQKAHQAYLKFHELDPDFQNPEVMGIFKDLKTRIKN